MGRARVIQTSFNAGELSPRMRGRIDEAAYAVGASEMLGFFGVLQGPAVAMPGTYYVESAPGPFRNLPFEYNVTQSYVIEASDHLFRFYTNDVLIADEAGAPITLETPWSYAQVLELDFEQSLDVMYFVHPDVAPQELRRTSATAFELVPLDLQNGPIDDANPDDDVTVSASGDTGSVTLTANQDAFFAAGDVGGFFQLEAGDYASVPAWEPGITVGIGQDKASDGKVYTSETAGRTGSVQPTHSSGAEYDGMVTGKDLNDKDAGGVLWRYKHDRYGLTKITAVAAGGASATATVLRRIPTGYATPTPRWAWGGFSDRRGWPEAVTIWNQRLTFAKQATLYGSVVGGYDDFALRDAAGDFERDQAFVSLLPNPNRIRWLAADRKLLIGTARAEHVAEQLQVTTGTPGPPVIEVDTQSTYGSRKTKPVMADGRVLFIQRAGRKVHELGYEALNDRYEAPDMTRLADHLGSDGFVELAWVQEPERQMWAVQPSGMLACMTYSPSQQVFGWSRRQLGGGMKARTVCAVTAPDGTRDQLWIGVETSDGQWWQLRMAPLRNLGDPQEDAFYVDAGLSYSGDPIQSDDNGLAHLAGKTVTGLADGKPHRAITVDAEGGWALDYPASTIHLGFAFPARMTDMPIEAGAADGTAQGRTKRIPQVSVSLIESQGVQVTVQGCAPRVIEKRKASDPMDAAVPLWTGVEPIDSVGDFETGGTVTIERVAPTPVMVAAIIAAVETTGR